MTDLPARVERITSSDMAAAKAIGEGRPVWGALSAWHVEQSEACVILGARDTKGTLVGVLWLETGGDWCDILDIVVRAEARKGGHGSALIKAAIALAQHKQSAGITLEVAVDNEAAIALYSSFGFAKVHRRPNYYATPRGFVDALVMSCPVDRSLPG